MKYIETCVNRDESLHEVYARGTLFDDMKGNSSSFQFDISKCYHPVPVETTSCAFVVMTTPHWRGIGHTTPDFSTNTVAISFPDELRGNDDALLEYVKPKFVRARHCSRVYRPQLLRVRCAGRGREVRDVHRCCQRRQLPGPASFDVGQVYLFTNLF